MTITNEVKELEETITKLSNSIEYDIGILETLRKILAALLSKESKNGKT